MSTPYLQRLRAQYRKYHGRDQCPEDEFVTVVVAAQEGCLRALKTLSYALDTPSNQLVKEIQSTPLPWIHEAAAKYVRVVQAQGSFEGQQGGEYAVLKHHLRDAQETLEMASVAVRELRTDKARSAESIEHHVRSLMESVLPDILESLAKQVGSEVEDVDIPEVSISASKR